jgi:hypothetical protein
VNGSGTDLDAAIALPPWGGVAPRFAYFHTARGSLAAEDRAVELIGLEGGGASLTTRIDGTVVEFIPGPDRRARDGEDRLPSLRTRLLRWHELCGRDAVARPFERLDWATRFALDQIAEPIEPAGSR